ncbi:MAG: hypothetical protein ACJASU_002335 [Cognaticolwellia sp.]|jgi:hypothetical protein
MAMNHHLSTTLPARILKLSFVWNKKILQAQTNRFYVTLLLPFYFKIQFQHFEVE